MSFELIGYLYSTYRIPIRSILISYSQNNNIRYRYFREFKTLTDNCEIFAWQYKKKYTEKKIDLTRKELTNNANSLIIDLIYSVIRSAISKPRIWL